MSTQHPHKTQGESSRVAPGWPGGWRHAVRLAFSTPAPLWGAEAGSPSAAASCAYVGGIPPLRFPSHDQQLHELHVELRLRPAGPAQNRRGRAAGYLPIEPDLAERWEEPDDTTVVFHLRKGVKWHNKPPLNGREFVAEDEIHL